jgi:EAL domain-containing protein (putative c-di-GMP-specific phosphodiesterase class I)
VRRLRRPHRSVKPLVIEITERELLYSSDTARELLKPFLDFGLRLALMTSQRLLVLPVPRGLPLRS